MLTGGAGAQCRELACLGGGRCELGERLAARTAGSLAESTGRCGTSTHRALGAGTLGLEATLRRRRDGAGGHPQETQGWGRGAACIGDKPDPCSCERVVCPGH